MNNLDNSDIPLKYKNAFVKAALNDSRMRGAGLSNAEMKYWDKAARQSGGIGPDYDYGSVKNITKDSRGHSGDEGKLPWHPTFSNQSKYAGLAAYGTWDNIRPDGSGDYHLTPKIMNDDRMWNLQMAVNQNRTDGDRYFFPNGKQMLPRKR